MGCDTVGRRGRGSDPPAQPCRCAQPPTPSSLIRAILMAALAVRPLKRAGLLQPPRRTPAPARGHGARGALHPTTHRSTWGLCGSCFGQAALRPPGHPIPLCCLQPPPQTPSLGGGSAAACRAQAGDLRSCPRPPAQPRVPASNYGPWWPCRTSRSPPGTLGTPQSPLSSSLGGCSPAPHTPRTPSPGMGGCGTPVPCARSRRGRIGPLRGCHRSRWAERPQPGELPPAPCPPPFSFPL